MAKTALQKKLLDAQANLGADSLKKAQTLIAEARDVEMDIQDLQARINEKTERLREIKERELVDLFQQIGITELKIEATGNLPEYSCKIKPFYSAGIAASWDDERKEEGFDYLEKVGAGDLIKRTFTVEVDRHDPTLASKVRTALEKLDADYDEKKAVHAGTLKAWLREQVEKAHTVPERLDLIGGSVGTIADLKPIKARKGK